VKKFSPLSYIARKTKSTTVADGTNALANLQRFFWQNYEYLASKQMESPLVTPQELEILSNNQ
jgi:hypothetical protein